MSEPVHEWKDAAGIAARGDHVFLLAAAVVLFGLASALGGLFGPSAPAATALPPPPAAVAGTGKPAAGAPVQIQAPAPGQPAGGVAGNVFGQGSAPIPQGGMKPTSLPQPPVVK